MRKAIMLGAVLAFASLAACHAETPATTSADAVFLRDCWYMAAPARDIKAGGMKKMTDIAVYAVADMSKLIEENGYFYDQSEVTNIGYWSWKKLAEVLPYDYLPQQ